MKDVVTDAGEGSKLSRANRPIQNKIGDGRKIAPVIGEPKIDFSIFGRIQEWIVINQNRILTTWRAQNCAFPFPDCHLEQI